MTTSHSRRRFLKSVGLGAAAVAMPSVFAHAAGAKHKPNFVFFFSDDQTWFDCGCYGNTAVRTPNIDRLAKQGMRFSAAFTGMALCAPSRSMLYTGLYPHRNGCFLNQSAAFRADKSIVHDLRPLGYTVALAGKKHVRPRGTFPFEIVETEQRYVTIGDRRIGGPVPVKNIDAFVEAHREEPFCLFVASGRPHAPYPDKTGYRPEDVIVPPHLPDTQKLRETLTGYYELIERMDKNFGAVLDSLDKHGLSEKTVVFFSSDQGGPGGKDTLYDVGVKVPFVVRWPGVVKPGSECDALVSFADVVPTLVEIAGGRMTRDVDGESIVPLLRGKADEHHDYVYGTHHYQNKVANNHVFPRRMVRSKKYKYIWNPNALSLARARVQAEPDTNPWILEGAMRHPDTPAEELFDMQADPWEQNNLAEKPGMQAVKAELRAELFAWMKRQGDPLADPDAMPIYKHAKRKPGWRRPRRR